MRVSKRLDKNMYIKYRLPAQLSRSNDKSMSRRGVGEESPEIISFFVCMICSEPSPKKGGR